MANIPFYKGQNLNIIANLANSIKFDKTKKNKLNATNVQDAIDEIAEGAGITNVTRAQYNALTEAQKNSGTYFITDEAEIGDAASVSYVNDGTSLTSTNVQGAISELNDTITKEPSFSVYEYTREKLSNTLVVGNTQNNIVAPYDGFYQLSVSQNGISSSAFFTNIGVNGTILYNFSVNYPSAVAGYTGWTSPLVYVKKGDNVTYKCNCSGNPPREMICWHKL